MCRYYGYMGGTKRLLFVKSITFTILYAINDAKIDRSSRIEHQQLYFTRILTDCCRYAKNDDNFIETF